MATQRTDRTGQRYGALQVLDLSKDNGRQWWVHWTCCGREEILDSMRVSHFSQKPPPCCKACAKTPEFKDAASTYKRVQKPDLRDRSKSAQESTEASRNQAGVLIRGRGWWPVLHGPMGPRWGIGTATRYDKGQSA